MEMRPPAYLSASRLQCYTYCPAEFYKRYILKHDEPPTPERSFGTAVHKGIEAFFLGLDPELAYLREWRALKQLLDRAQQLFSSGLERRGLELLDMVVSLGISGEPERQVIVTAPDLSLPILGYTDLWTEGHIWDFKTTGYGWTQDKADAQIFQPAIYSQAHADEYGSIPRFTFIILPRIQGPAQILDGTRTGDQIIAAFDRIREIHQLIEAQEFDCICQNHTEAA